MVSVITDETISISLLSASFVSIARRLLVNVSSAGRGIVLRHWELFGFGHSSGDRIVAGTESHHAVVADARGVPLSVDVQ